MNRYEYQNRAIQEGVRDDKKYFAIDMGLGKTNICIGITEALQLPTFVVAPLKVIENTWPEEIETWSPQLSYRILHGRYRSIANMDSTDIVLINYESLKWLANQKGRWRKRILIVDEATMIKSHSSIAFKLLCDMQKLGFFHEQTYLLSGTPAPYSLSDLWSQYYLLDEGRALGKNISEFRSRYCDTKYLPKVPVPVYKVKDSARDEIITAIKPMTFRLSAKDYLELPPEVSVVVSCNLPQDLQQQYNQLKRDLYLEVEDALIMAKNAMTVGTKLRQFVQGVVYTSDKQVVTIHREKLIRLKEIYDAANGTPILCPIQFRSEMLALKDMFPKAPFIVGGTKDTNQIFKDWNARRIPIMFCHPASMAYGLNLQYGGSTIVWFGLPWKLVDYLQLNGRLSRLGQTSRVIIHHIIMRNTVDERVYEALRNRIEVLNYLQGALKHER